MTYEIHGWVVLCSLGGSADDTIRAKCEAFRHRVEKIVWHSGNIEMLLLNGQYVLRLNAVLNHRSAEAGELKNLLEEVVVEYCEAYGLVYEYDENTEIPGKGLGVFSVTVVRRGRLETALDPFLSPFFPVVEDLG